MSRGTLRPTRLLCEHLEDPLAVDARRPRFSWTVEADPDDRGQRQNAYRILVAGSEEELANDHGTLWNSGRVSSSETLDVVYEGAALGSAQRCFWKVMVWDCDDEPGPWSEAAVFGVGLLEGSDWEASWVRLPHEVLEGTDVPEGEHLDDLAGAFVPAAYLRKEFAGGAGLRRATLYATARGVYEARLNGRKVGDHVLAPGWTDYRKRVQYQAFDVTGMLGEGDNVLGAVVGDGWYSGFVGMNPKRRGALYGDMPWFLAHLRLEFADGTVRTIVTDDTWKSAVGPILHSDLLMGESYDARRALPGWDAAGYDDSAWEPAHPEAIRPEALVAERSQPIRVTAELEPVSVEEPEPGTFVFDMGQNMVGWAKLTVEGEEGDTVGLRFAEALNPDGTLYTENLRSARQTDAYVLGGDGEEFYEPRFTFHGFRYVEVTGFPGRPRLSSVVGRVVGTDAPITGKFECSDPMVNRLWRNILWGQKGNFLSVPTDCPQRDERLGWMADAQVFCATGCYNMDLRAFFDKWMADVRDVWANTGTFPNVAPVPPGLERDLSKGAPAWGDAGVLVPWTLWRRHADERVIEDNWEAMASWMGYIHEANPDHLRTSRLHNNFGDWLSVGADTPKEVLATACWARCATAMAQMARATGRESAATGYEELFGNIAAAFDRAYVDDEGRVEGGTQTCYALALAFGLLPEEKRELAAGHLAEDIKRRDVHLTTGFVGVGHLLPVLCDHGHEDLAYCLLLQDTFPSWGYCIENGATAVWERWDGWTEEKGFQSPNMNSFNHYSLGSVGEWLYRYVAGINIEPGEQGRRIIITPHPTEKLGWARAGYDSAIGRVESEWEILEGEGLRLRVSIPANADAEIRVPVPPGTAGVPTTMTEDADLVEAADGQAVLRTGSGRYEMVWERS